MIQGYFLSVVFLATGAMLFLMEPYRTQFSFMIRFRSFLEEKALWAFILFGSVTALLLLFFPVYPGPFLLGDLIPAVFIIYQTIYFGIRYSRKRLDKNEAREYSRSGLERKKAMGFILLSVAALHFLLPSFVLL